MLQQLASSVSAPTAWDRRADVINLLPVDRIIGQEYKQETEVN